MVSAVGAPLAHRAVAFDFGAASFARDGHRIAEVPSLIKIERVDGIDKSCRRDESASVNDVHSSSSGCFVVFLSRRKRNDYILNRIGKAEKGWCMSRKKRAPNNTSRLLLFLAVVSIVVSMVSLLTVLSAVEQAQQSVVYGDNVAEGQVRLSVVGPEKTGSARSTIAGSVVLNVVENPGRE